MTDFFSGKCAPASGFASTHPNALQWQFVQQFSGSYDRPAIKNFPNRFYRLLPLVPFHQNWTENIRAEWQQQQQTVQSLSTDLIIFKIVLL
ncbi:hypothetical protein DC498_09725 [Terrimonas sp.]|nr:hypothetical protein DC498_09725 [Terrimonas sp.]